MAIFNLCQKDTKTVNHIIPEDLVFKKVFFVFGDGVLQKKIGCVQQSVTSQNYTPWSKGGVAIPFTKNDLEQAGTFRSQFILVDKYGNQTTFPQMGYLEMKVQERLINVY